MAAEQSTRVEEDLIGSLDVPADAWYGIHTLRAMRNFPIDRSGEPRIGDFPALVDALVHCKQAAARANRETGHLDAQVAGAIEAAGERVLRERRYEAFPVHALHGGGGTSAHMNVNEVLANLAETALGGRLGEYRLVHPNDHVNLHQSTNDVYPTACRLALRRDWIPLREALYGLRRAVQSQVERYGDLPRLARTCLQDAIAIRFADFLGGYESFLSRRIAETDAAVTALRIVPLGGTAVGRASDVPDAYWTAVIDALRETSGFPDLEATDNFFDAFQNMDDLVHVAQMLDLLARGLIKMAKDLRLLASGPEGGLGEIVLPAVQAGSSIMPGKINPVIPEFMVQAGFRTLGLVAMAGHTLDHGELDLNIWESAACIPILQAMGVLHDAVGVFAGGCVAGLEPDTERNRRHAEGVIPYLAEMMKTHGYSKVTALWKASGHDRAVFERMIDSAVSPNSGRARE